MPQGEWEFTVGGDYGDATIVVSGRSQVVDPSTVNAPGCVDRSVMSR